MTQEQNQRLQRLLSGRKPLLWAAVLAAAGVVLLLCTRQSAPETPLPAESAQISAEAVMEARLQSLVTAITGDPKVSVLVTLEEDARAVYAIEDKTSTNGQSVRQSGEQTDRSQTGSENSYVIIKNADGSQSALKLTEIYPQVKGVVVVTPCAEDARMHERIVHAAMTAFGISSSRVCVVRSN